MRGVLDAVEGFFSAITPRRIRRGVFTSVAELEDAIRRYIADHNRHAKPFAWTKTADETLEKLTCIPSAQTLTNTPQATTKSAS